MVLYVTNYLLFSDTPSELFISPLLFLNIFPFLFLGKYYSYIQAQIKHHLRQAFPNPQNELSHSLLHILVALPTNLYYSLFILCSDFL